MKFVSANEARKLSKINSGIIDTKIIQSNIAGAIEDGETIAIISRTYFTNGIGRISDADLRMLKDLGYTVTSNKYYYVILWGDEINKDYDSNREVIDPIEIDFESLNNNYPDINKFFIK